MLLRTCVIACGWALLVGPADAAVELRPGRIDRLKSAVRASVAAAAPQATAAQAARWGLKLPQPLDPARPLVILIHGIDSRPDVFATLAGLLRQEGCQVAFYSYPNDQALADSAARFGREMVALHERWPQMPLEVITSSMGGLVARAYIEGPDYAGGVEHLILTIPPNHGSAWARLRPLLEVADQWRLARSDPQWRATWMITDGLGEAGRDLLPGSRFLTELNARPRRQGVEYTIIAGCQNPVFRIGAAALDAADAHAPSGLQARLNRSAQRLRDHRGRNDGVVSIESARLSGVDDVVLLGGDHVFFHQSAQGRPPAEWGIIRQRLSR